MDTTINEALINGIFSIIAIVMTSICTIVTYKVNNKVKEKQEEEKFPPLSSHPVHVNIDDHIRNAKCISLPNVSEGRIKLANDFMEYVIRSWKQPCLDFAEEMQKCIDGCGSNCNECNRIYTLAMKLLREGRSYDNLSNWNIDSDDYEAVVVFRDKFVEWNHDRMERLTKKISDISLINDTYKNCSIKSARILECIDDYIYDMYKDGIHVLSKLNGELTGKTYKCNIL